MNLFIHVYSYKMYHSYHCKVINTYITYWPLNARYLRKTDFALLLYLIQSCFFQNLENLNGTEEVKSSKKKSQQKSNVQNTPTNKQTTEVKRSRKRAQKDSDPMELETGEKCVGGLRSSQTQAETNSAKRLKQPLTRSRLKKQKGR